MKLKKGILADKVSDDIKTMFTCKISSGPICEILGGPRIITFDSSNYPLLYACDYVLSMDCEAGSWLVYGRITPCGESGICLESVTIYSEWDHITLHRGWMVTKGDRKLHFVQDRKQAAGNFIIFYDGLYIAAILEGQLRVTWDGIATALIEVLNDLPTCGLCGNSDGHKTLSRGGKQLGDIDISQFTHSWRVDPESDCKKNIAVPRPSYYDSVLTKTCHEIFENEHMDLCREEYSPDIYTTECDHGLILKHHVLGSEFPVECYFAQKYLKSCATRTGFTVATTLSELKCPSIRFVQDFASSIGCPQKKIPFYA